MFDREKNIERCADALERIADVLEAGRKYIHEAGEQFEINPEGHCVDCIHRYHRENCGSCNHHNGWRNYENADDVVNQEEWENRIMDKEIQEFMKVDIPGEPLDGTPPSEDEYRCPRCDQKVYHNFDTDFYRCENCAEDFAESEVR